jgi:DNA-binding response OmpR family regulator
MTTILWIEGSSNDSPSFVPGLRNKGYLVSTVPTGKEALPLVATLDPNLAVVNAASLHISGVRICRDLRRAMNVRPILLIGSEGTSPHHAHATHVLVLPFTIRKLINRIKALVPKTSTDVLQVGPLSLYPDLRIVRCDQGEPKRLTPRQVMLLKMLMEHPGEALERDRLFREVWQTDYVGDTRTLDVHISWLRKVIEKDHRSPQLLKTLRGVGYRLDV